MHPDAVLALLLATLVSLGLPLLALYRAYRRIRDLEMTLLTQTVDGQRYEELLGLLKQVAAQTDQLSDTQTQLVRRLAERGEWLLPPDTEESKPVTPHWADLCTRR
jgi:uncharacterized coiled-coil protein SlyX